jgi:outer membrane protein insertion porin family
MGGRWLVVALILFTRAAPAGALTVDALPPDRGYRLATVKIEGVRALSRSTILGAMVTRRPPWYQLWRRWTQTTPFSVSLFRGDLERVERLLRELGYYHARVSHDLIVHGDAVTVVLRVDEGPVATVAEVALAAAEGTLAPADEAALRAELTLAPGDAFTQEQYDESQARLLREYRRRGYAYVRVEKAAVVDTATDRVRVRYTIAPGRTAVFGTTTVHGETRVAPDLILRELAYAAGDAYDPRKLDLTQARVFGLRLFRSAVVRPAQLDPQSPAVDIAIEVVEGPPRELKAGIGYGDEEGVRGQLRWEHNNWLGGGRQLGFGLTLSQLTQEGAAEFRQPYFLGPRQVLVVPLRQARDDEPEFTNAVVSLTPRIERRLTPSVTAALGWVLEYDDVTDIPDATRARLEELRRSGVVSGPTAWIERNTTTDLLDPRSGSVVRFAVAQAGGPWQGGYTFARGLLEAKKYVAVSSGMTLAGRVRIGGGDGFGQSRDLPVFRRFFAGGIDSTRGYGRHLLGPLNASGDPVGGRSLLEGNLELRAPIRGPVGGALFVDIGEVRRQPFSYSLEDLKLGVGVGVRYQTLIGPLRLDLGIPLDPPRGEPSWRVHFSIGQAF